MNNNNNNNNEYNNKLYNSVFNNIYLKKIILNHLNKYNILYNNIEFMSYKELQEFKYKEYLNRITCYFELDLNELPENIKHVKVYFKELSKPINSNEFIPIPDQIKSLSLSTPLESSSVELFKLISSLPISESTSKFNSLSLQLIQLELEPNLIPQSITNLNIEKENLRIHLANDILPKTLKTLSIESIESFDEGCLPESLTSLCIDSSTPLLLNQLPSFNNLVELEFISPIFGGESRLPIGSNITFPKSLQKLSIECSTFNAKLPDSLKTFNLIMKQFDYEIIFPSTLEYLTIYFKHNKSNLKVFNSRQEAPVNLKSIEFPCTSIVDDNGQSILPEKLQKLVIYGNGLEEKLKVNHLPPNLTHLFLGQGFNQEIDINVLPSTLKTLNLGSKTSHVINPLAIPQNLELLQIYNRDYRLPINLTSTHPYTKIGLESIDLYDHLLSDPSIRVLRLPNSFNSPLSTLKLQDKSSLEYLNLGFRFSYPIQLSDLPIKNNIKTLELSYDFTHTINLEHFQNLETLIILYIHPVSPKIITTIADNNNNINNNIKYNNYKLKNIIVSPHHHEFIKQLDINFYQFLKYI